MECALTVYKNSHIPISIICKYYTVRSCDLDFEMLNSTSLFKKQPTQISEHHYIKKE